MKVISPPNPVLLGTARNVDLDNKNSLKTLGQLLLDMEETLLLHEDPPGVGLAAPQVGVDLRIYLALINELQVVESFINPEFVEMSEEMDTSKTAEKALEGCLSLPSFYGPVRRHLWVKVHYWSVDLDKLKAKRSVKECLIEKTEIYKEFEARIMQHEMDHINGTLFTARLIEQKGQLYQLEIRNGEEVFVPIKLPGIL